MNTPIEYRRHDLLLLPQSKRVILKPFIPHEAYQLSAALSRVLELPEGRVKSELDILMYNFAGRHRELRSRLLSHYDMVVARIVNPRIPTLEHKLLVGALVSGEYALESAALFNPSIVSHPDQQGVSDGELRFILSLRATGEGHISSIEFRSGVIDAHGMIRLDETTSLVSAAEPVSDPRYDKAWLKAVLGDAGSDVRQSAILLGMLGDTFPKSELIRCMHRLRSEMKHSGQDFTRMLHSAQDIVDSNYESRFSPVLALDERALFPVSSNESNGMEDARFVRFLEDDGRARYLATYTAYNGIKIHPQLLETADFMSFSVRTLYGNAVRNKGMAIFPRRIQGRYAMLSRQDGENLFLMYSDRIDFWSEARVIMRPAQFWESVKIGNCGSPIETPAGWLVITHGVGPMRRYCLGAVLLDIEDPAVIIGRLKVPLLEPDAEGREGYVPNVVYSCGAIIHGGELILPFAMSDRRTSFVSIGLDSLLENLKNQQG